jgi:succinyl-CoA synthetase beta subunit
MFALYSSPDNSWNTWLQTGASLKLTILNPKGRIWTMVAGGGASVIYSDTVLVILVSECVVFFCSCVVIPCFLSFLNQ